MADYISKLGTLESEQELLKKESGDYTQVKRIIEDGIDYEIHEYGNPLHGYWGYQINFYEKREDGKYRKTIGYGTEAESRTFDWYKLEKDGT